MRTLVPDPLAGFRDKINNGDIAVLRFPADQPCPVEKGDSFELRSCSIVIESVNRKLPAGKPAEWHVQFVRMDTDRPQLLRRVPSGLPTPHDKHDGLSAIERARRESAYTSSPKQALVDEPESVGPDWKDPGAAEREVRRQEVRRSERLQEENKRAISAFKARLSGDLVEHGKKGHDLTPLLDEIYSRLATLQGEHKEAA
jgi:hypothetical protein